MAENSGRLDHDELPHTCSVATTMVRTAAVLLG
jgi:hypothetical protein